MQIWMTLVLALQLLSALAMIGLVLIQHGKGADMGASFGSGASGSLFGASGSANFLSRSTAALATVFFVCTLALAYMGSTRSGSAAEGSSVLDRPAGGGSAPVTAPGVIPGAAVPPPAGPATAPVTPSPTPSTVPSPVPAPAATLSGGPPTPSTAASR